MPIVSVPLWQRTRVELPTDATFFSLLLDVQLSHLWNSASDSRTTAPLSSSYVQSIIPISQNVTDHADTQTNFIQQPLPPGSNTGAGGQNGQSGALGLGQRASTGLTTFNSFWYVATYCSSLVEIFFLTYPAFQRVYVIPLFGAYIADTRWGRFKTVCWSVAIALFGHVLLIISAVPGVITNPNGSLACFCIAIIIMGLG